MRTDLYRDPKVCAMTDFLLGEQGPLSRYVTCNDGRNASVTWGVTRTVTRNATVGALVSVWGVLRHRGHRVGDDLVIKHVRLSVIDDMAEIPGFGEAMALVGWAQETEEGVVFTNFFEEHNAEPGSKLRSKNADRQARYRERKAMDETRNVTRNVTLRPREEERREEKRREESIKAKALTPSPPLGMSAKVKSMPDGFVDFWKAYPRKVGQAAAIKSFAKLNSEEVSGVIDAVTKHASRWMLLGTESQFIPHPATWLNQSRWKDDLGTDQSQRPAQPQSRQASIVDVLRSLRNASPSNAQSRLALPGSHHGVSDAYAEQLSPATRARDDSYDRFSLGEDAREESFE